MSKKTQILIDGLKYPFYKTNRGQFDFENSQYTVDDLVRGKQSAMFAWIFFNARACAKRAGMEFTWDFDGFIDATDEDVIKVFAELLDEPEAKGGDESKNLKAPANSETISE